MRRTPLSWLASAGSVGLLLGMAAVPLACASADRGTTSGPQKPATGTPGTPATGNEANNNGPGPSFVDNPNDGGNANLPGDVCAPDPSRYEAPDNGCDDDGDGKVDNVASACDTGLAVGGDADQFARAIGLCQKASGPSDTKWGVISAKYMKGYNDNGAPPVAQHGILGAFGNVVKPRDGSMFGVLSSGYARVYDSDSEETTFKDGVGLQTPNFFSSPMPPGFPKSAPGCPTINLTQDIVVAHLEIKVPKNAQGFQFDFNFYSGEWPEFVCTAYNDSFIAYLKSSAFNGGKADNMSFDSKGAPVSVNNAFFDRCTPNTPVGCRSNGAGAPSGTATCAGGAAELAGTGFGQTGTFCGGALSTGGGATGWLTSKAPVKGGEVITLEFYIWDGGDGAYDSSVLIDNFKWVPTPVVAETTRPK